jgi:hypothetical protein
MLRTYLLRTIGCVVALFGVAPFGYSQEIFTNNTPITIPALGPATPSVISVSGYTGTITGFTLTINGLTHSFTDDIGAIVTGPGGQKTILFDGPGTNAGLSVTGVNLTFDDAAAAPLPNDAAFGTGVFQPGQNEWNDVFTATGVPPGPYATTFGAFIGSAPNGDYTLYVEDFVGGDGGSIQGWSISIFGITPVPEPGSILLGAAGFGLAGAAIRRRWRVKQA